MLKREANMINSLEMLAFVLYLLIVITIGVYFYFKGRKGD